MKNLNKKWFYFNPLFVLYSDDPWFIEALKDSDRNELYYYDPIQDRELDPFDGDERQMNSRDSNETEGSIINHPSAHLLRQQFKKSEEFHHFLGYSLNYDFQKLPVALITFVLSVFIATNFSFRQNFFTVYQGKKIPAVTRWCLNTFRISPISDREWITDFRFIDNEYRATQSCCGLSNTFADIETLKLYPEYIVAWFDVLDQHFSTDPKPYMEWVRFRRVSSVSREKNYLCGLTVKNGAVTSGETAYFYELSDSQKRIYTMLARVLDCVCVPENTELPVPHKNLLERDFDERVMVPQLIRFIVSECKTFLT